MLDDLTIPDGRLCCCPACQRVVWADTSDCPLCRQPGLLHMPPTPHPHSDARDILRRFQAYRRGHDPRTLTDTGLSTAAIGEAIDAGIAALDLIQEQPHVTRH